MARYAYYFERNKGTVAKSQKTYGIVVDYFKKKNYSGRFKTWRETSAGAGDCGGTGCQP